MADRALWSVLLRYNGIIYFFEANRHGEYFTSVTFFTFQALYDPPRGFKFTYSREFCVLVTSSAAPWGA